MPVRPRSSGDPLKIRASEWNAIARATNAYTELDQGGASGRRRLPPGVVLVKNTTATAFARFQPLRLTAPLFAPADLLNEYLQEPAFQGIVAAGLDMPAAFLAVARETIPAGAVGQAVVSGVHPIRADILASGHHALRVTSGGLLTSCVHGQTKIMHQPAATGPQYVLAAFNPAAQPLEILARITDSTSLATNRWEYDWEEVVRVADTIVVPTLARTSETDGIAYNLIEAGNTGGGRLGNGVLVVTIPDGFALVPIGNNAVVRMTKVVASWDFQTVNQLDGTCLGS